MARTATIAGEEITLGDFMAYKAFHAMEIATQVEDAGKQLLEEAAKFKREFESENYVELERAEARRFYPPTALYFDEPVLDEKGEPIISGDGDVLYRNTPVLDDDGRPVMGPDPLGHLTEEDWAAHGHKLRVPDSPTTGYQIAAVVPKAFDLARSHVLRLLALVLTSNDELEKWDDDPDVDIDARLDQEARRLLHRAKADELVDLAIESYELLQEQLAGPFGRLRAIAEKWWSDREEEPKPTEVEGMAIETEPDQPIEPDESSSSRPTTSTDSPADTDGGESESSTAPASVSSSSSVPA